MQITRRLQMAMVWGLTIVLGCMPLAGLGEVIELGNEAPWNVSLSAGAINFEGDQPVDNGFVSALHLGYEFNKKWTLEGVFYYAPSLDAKERYLLDESGERIAGASASTFLVGGALDGLWHFTRLERWDPYLTLGLGYFHLGEDYSAYKSREDVADQDGFGLRGGVGLMYHFNDEWALRADFRGMLVGEGSEANSISSVGVCWTWGANVPPKYVVVGGPQDTDGDGLTDAEEAALGTNPRDPDTDHDGLTDYEEVKIYLTDPLNPDSDYDGLTDGEEVHGVYKGVATYKTNSLDRDTDDGGVADGHEVIEDNTNPLNPADDLKLFELYLQFDYDKSVIKAQYFPDLDVIGKMLARDPGATARIEGHADKLKGSSKSYNQKLSERRAEAVLDYLADKSKIERKRMTAVGYGFTRPKAPNHPVNGNPVNRRVEVYIRPGGHAASKESTVAPFEVKFEIPSAKQPADAPKAP